jgi:hypothetical protein
MRAIRTIGKLDVEDKKYSKAKYNWFHIYWGEKASLFDP